MKKLLPIVLPGIYSKEAFFLLVHTAFLVSRTFLSIYVAQLDGTIVKALVDRDLPNFIWNLLKWYNLFRQILLVMDLNEGWLWVFLQIM